ncbi:hypothetical protein DIPPA_09883 [Diplonema papillatum]|nr:hypothetical protein DIPPA_09883 [Diplonema papillatum]
MRAAAVSLSHATRLALRRRAGGSPCLSLRATPPEAPGAARSAGFEICTHPRAIEAHANDFAAWTMHSYARLAL